MPSLLPIVAAVALAAEPASLELSFDADPEVWNPTHRDVLVRAARLGEPDPGPVSVLAISPVEVVTSRTVVLDGLRTGGDGYRLVLHDGGDEHVLLEQWLPHAGENVLELAAPVLSPHEPGDAWGIPVRLVDRDGRALSPEPGWLAEALDADGRLHVAPLSGDPARDRVRGAMAPPVTVFLRCGTRAERCDGVVPGDVATFVEPCTGDPRGRH